ncbi:prepilin peptidase [Mycolicibacterium sp. S2-37]|uniref:prepilin peptidase n=1 Tax=Mycolicibacterium sp. S2-37 TaxID=2810297 RepID=UPI001A93ABDE|nr:A24 family peptidase [Mycolicibacterium sp. S2-37]MBO0676555.1 prepilin peptidase [Mycolicibacterium sp. S2-37]
MGELLAGACVVAWCITLSAFDIRWRRLPNWLTLPGAVIVLSVAVPAGRGMPAVAGAAALFAVYAAIHLAAPAGMGAGDVKLAIGLGALTGAFGVDVWILAALAAPLLTAVWGVALLVLRAESAVPHGPSMCLASAAAVGSVVL